MSCENLVSQLCDDVFNPRRFLQLQMEKLPIILQFITDIQHQHSWRYEEVSWSCQTDEILTWSKCNMQIIICSCTEQIFSYFHIFIFYFFTRHSYDLVAFILIVLSVCCCCPDQGWSIISYRSVSVLLIWDTGNRNKAVAPSAGQLQYCREETREGSFCFHLIWFDLIIVHIE